MQSVVRLPVAVAPCGRSGPSAWCTSSGGCVEPRFSTFFGMLLGIAVEFQPPLRSPASHSPAILCKEECQEPHVLPPCAKQGRNVMKPSHTLLIAAAFHMMPLTATAESGNWTEREICRAATQVYFFLSSPPEDISIEEGEMHFISATGSIYQCRLTSSTAVLSWTNNSGKGMVSESTRYVVYGDKLQVNTDLSEKIFISDDSR